MLRNPVDRAYSQFQMSRREGEEELDSFIDAVEVEDRRLDPERARANAQPALQQLAHRLLVLSHAQPIRGTARAVVCAPSP